MVVLLLEISDVQEVVNERAALSRDQACDFLSPRRNPPNKTSGKQYFRSQLSITTGFYNGC